MITSVASLPEPAVASQPAQPEVAPKALIREQAVPAAAVESQPAEAKAQAAAEPIHEADPKVAADGPQDINLRFRVDQKTQDITVFVLNQRTQEVIRTIPPNELAKLKPGDLVNLFA